MTKVQTSPPVRRTQQERRASTEQRILQAAVELIAGSGPSAVSLADIGQAAGYSRGIVTHAFGSRDELLRRVAIHAQESFVPPESDGLGLDRLLKLLDGYLEHVTRRPASARAFLLMWSEAAAPNSPLREVVSERDAFFAGVLRDYVADGVADGSIRPGVDAKAVGEVLLGQLRGIGIAQMLHPGARSASAVRREVHAMTRRALAG